jgi:lathosterol oxidase
MSHLPVQLTVFLTMAPAAIFFRWAVAPELQAAVAAQPYRLQLVEVLAVADLAQYTVHRLFHTGPWLWRFYAIHHSSRTMDWLAGSRLHLVDIVVTRGLSFVPLYVLGFAQAPVFAYVLFVSFQAVLIHAISRAIGGPPPPVSRVARCPAATGRRWSCRPGGRDREAGGDAPTR